MGETPRYRHDALIGRTTRLFAAAGLNALPARAGSEILVRAELLDSRSHGLPFVPPYLAGIGAGR